MIKVCMIGLGKTGLIVAKSLLNAKDIRLVMAVCSPQSIKEGKDLGEILNTRDTGIKIIGADKLSDNLKLFRPDVAVDFSSHKACVKNMEVLGKNKVNAVIATTGFNKFEEQKIKTIANQYKIGIVLAPNITPGVNVMRFVCELIAGLLNDYDVEIVETHHRHKKDSPSGTALKIADSVFRGKNVATKKIIYDRTKVNKRDDDEIGISSIRAGGVVGVHSAIFASEHDMIQISHQSFDRGIFAYGAIKAVKFINGKKGIYDMDDVLDLKSALQNYLVEDYVIG